MNHYAVAAGLLVVAGLAGGCSSAQPIGELRTHADESFAREEYKRTIAFDTEILRREPSDFPATVQRGVAYDRLGSFGDAQADYSRAIELQPDASLPRLYRANLAIKSNQPDVAVQDLQALQEMQLERHEQVATLCLAGTAAQRRGDWGGALRMYRQAIDLGKHDPDPTTQKHTRDALNNAAECCYRQGNFGQAFAFYNEAVQAKARVEEPVTEDDNYTLGVLAYLSGEFGRARHFFGHVSPARQKQAAKLLNDDGFFTSGTTTAAAK